MLSTHGRFYNFISGLCLDGYETREEAAMKLVMLPVYMIMSLLSTLLIAAHISLDARWLDRFPVIVCFLSSFSFMILIITTKKLSKKSIEYLCFVYMVCIMVLDLSSAAAMQERAWPLFVVIIDVLLIVGTDCRTSKIAVSIILLWLMIVSSDHASRWGLLDIPGTAPKSERLRHCDCGDPPCVVKATGISGLAMYILVFVVDFFFTVGFANQVRSEKQRIEESAQLAEKIASALVVFDLEDAEMYLTAAAGTDLSESLGKLLFNLRQYRPYLPDALFPDSDPRRSSSQQLSFNPTHTTAVAINILNVVVLWEDYQPAMKKAALLYNSIVRNLSEHYNGAELSNVADAILLSFAYQIDAINFSLELQTQVQQTTWPLELSEVGGLHLLVGLHCGASGELLKVSEVAWHLLDDKVCDVVIATSNVMTAVAGQVSENASILPHSTVEGETLSAEFTTKWLVPDLGASKKCAILENLDKERNRIIRTEVSNEAKGDEDRKNSSASYSTSIRGSVRSSVVSSMRKAILRSKLSEIPNVSAANVDFDYTFINSCDFPVTSVSDAISSVVISTDRTSGIVATVFGSTVVTVWNVSKKCSDHIHRSARFCGLLYETLERLDHLWTSRMTIGVANGSLMSGNIGNDKQRFIVVIGAVLELSSALSRSAATVGVVALAATVPGGGGRLLSSESSLNSFVRPIDTWNWSNTPIVVFQLRVSCLTRFTAKSSVGWDAAYEAAWKNSDVSLLRTLTDDDPTISKVINLLETNSHLMNPVIQGGFTGRARKNISPRKKSRPATVLFSELSPASNSVQLLSFDADTGLDN